MPWIPPQRVVPKGQRGGPQPSLQQIRCDKCSWETNNGYLGYKDSRSEAGVWWPKAEEHQGEGEHAWCPRCASSESDRADWSYHSTDLDIEAVMSDYRESTSRQRPAEGTPARHIIVIAFDRRKVRSLGGGGG